MSTFVSVGNATQPFRRMLDAVCNCAADLPSPVFVQYGAAGGFDCVHCDGAAFLDMETFAERVAGAELLILHAGAGSVIHAIRAGKVPVVMPRRARFGEHVDDHQVEFANELARMGKVILCEEAGRLPGAAQEAIARQRSIASRSVTPPLVYKVRELILGHARGSNRGRSGGQ